MESVWTTEGAGTSFADDVPLVEFMYLAFTRMPGERLFILVVVFV